ncbi:MAG: amino acid adenylation domain-containing protein [Nostoc sp. DedSLP03]|uniref:amino acid adenylation domain-containing protein n=1 Tax=Nostoc sp. DedSLP03 TaxID=3075400 RepID=UPI002AD455E3|nr:amino acid adenylation domain-containing protein [Nostoc sp. DedSLP03]MDZ7963727.1 amino acid adenylation domain-containing protein [Nostoc sp. DedSLP03]
MQSTIGDGFRISPQQKHLWVLQQNDYSSRVGRSDAFGGLRLRQIAYYSQIAIRIEGNFAPDILKVALENIIKRQEIFRTVFNYLPEVSIPLQFVTENSMLMFEERDLSSLASQEQKIAINALFQDRGWQTFDLQKGPLLYIVLNKLSSGEQILFISLPAIYGDLTTLHNLVKEIYYFYEAYLHGRELDDESMQYADISAWLNELLESEDTETGREFWQKQDVFSLLKGKIPLENHSSAKVRFEPQSLTLEINSDTVTKLEMLVRKYGTSISVFLLACWQIQLWRFTEQSDIIVGTASNGRKYQELKDILGLLTKYLPIHSHLEENLYFKELLEKVEETLSSGHKWEEYFSWEQVAAKNGNGTEPPFFPFCFDFQEQPANCVVGNVLFSLYKQYTCIDRFKVKLSGVRLDEGLLLEFHYDSNLFPLKNIKILSEQYLTLLESAIAHPDNAIADLEMCSDRQRQQLLYEWNETFTNYPQEQCIHSLFEAQVERTPEGVAVVFEDRQLTYRELNNRANQLAHYLKTLGVQTETLVGICVERSLEMVVGILAVLKAGGAYVPLDPNYPSERLVYMLQDAGIVVLLTQHKLQKNLTDCQVNIICLDTDWEKIASVANENPKTQVKPENLAYVIYTSGSTGLPKGVAIEHRQLFNYLNSIQTVLNLPLKANYATVSTIAADLGHTVIFPSLCGGGCLHIISSEQITSAKDLSDYFGYNSIDCLKIVPSHLKALLTSEAGAQILPRQRLVLGGESTSWELIEQIQQLAPECQIINHYGPTEATVGVLTYQVEGVPDTRQSSTVPIGCPLANTQIYILDSKKQPTPISVPGEVYIGGAGLARGYLHRPELTAEKFVPNPFSDNPQSRLYKTGDLARYLPDGNIEYIGRIDNQVKIRGFRIELGEIEAVLSQYPHVQQVTVIASVDTPGDKQLVAYLVSDAEENPSISDLRQFLKEKLPEYMVPAAFVYLDALPLTPNGKIDRRALPVPDLNNIAVDNRFFRSLDLVEQQLAEIWSQVLNLYPIGVKDNFFELGGHSLLAVQLMAKIEQQFRINLPLSVLFQNSTIQQLATFLRQPVDTSIWSPLVAVKPSGSNKPFFCVPGAGGNPIYFYNLAHHLGPEQPFYGLQALGLDGESEPHTQVEIAATFYIQAIQSIQPKGPYLLGGHSFGSKVAFEMAQQLQKLGHEVALLALFDTAAPNVDDVDAKSQHVGVDNAFWLKEVGVVMEELYETSLDISYEVLKSFESEEEQLKYFQERLQLANVLPAEIGIKQLRGLVQVYKTQVDTIYQPKNTETINQITCFMASDEKKFSEDLENKALSWGKFSKLPVNIQVVPGKHITMLNEPHVRVLAEKLKDCLEKIQETG